MPLGACRQHKGYSPCDGSLGGAPKSAREIKGDFPEVAVPQMGRVGVLQKNRHVGKACLVRGMAYEKAQASSSCLGNHEPLGAGGP